MLEGVRTHTPYGASFVLVNYHKVLTGAGRPKLAVQGDLLVHRARIMWQYSG